MRLQIMLTTGKGNKMKQLLWAGMLFMLGHQGVVAENATDHHPAYTVSFSKDMKTADVAARLTLFDNRIKMPSWGHPNLPMGWATFVHGLTVTNEAGQNVEIETVEGGWGAWNVAAENGQTLNLHYQVHFDHHQHDWNPAGGQDSRPALVNGSLFLVHIYKI